MTDYQEEQKRLPEDGENILPPKTSGGWRNFAFVILLMFVFVFVSTESAYPCAEGSNIISDLRSMKWAVMKFYEESPDFLPEVPKDVNVCKYLIQYMDNPNKFNDSRYIFIIIGDSWWVGYDLDQVSCDARYELARKATSVGLFGSSQPVPPLYADRAYKYNKKNDFVWLLARRDDGGIE